MGIESRGLDVGSGDLGADLAWDVLTDLGNLPLVRYPHVALLEQAFELRENVTV
jgi:hypothetical protein